MPGITLIRFRGAAVSGSLTVLDGIFDPAITWYGAGASGSLGSVDGVVDLGIPFYGSGVCGSLVSLDDVNVTGTFTYLMWYGGAMSGCFGSALLYSDPYFTPTYFEEHEAHASGGSSCELTGGSVEHDEHSGS